MQRVALGVCAALAVGLTYWVFTYWSDGSAESASTPDLVARQSDAGTWIPLLREAAEVTFARSTATGEAVKISGKLTTLGPLPEESKERARQLLAIFANGHSLALAQGKAETGKPEDYLAFLQEMYYHEKFRLAAGMLEQGDYVTTPSDSPMIDLPEQLGFVGLPSVGTLGDKPVDVWFFIDLDSNPAALAARDAAHEFEGYRLDEEVVTHNSMDVSARKSRIEESDRASKELRNWPKSRPAEEAIPLRMQQISTEFTVNRSNWTISRRLTKLR
jgi:hypothetical protein